jgi:hypothetical protein
VPVVSTTNGPKFDCAAPVAVPAEAGGERGRDPRSLDPHGAHQVTTTVSPGIK